MVISKPFLLFTLAILIFYTKLSNTATGFIRVRSFCSNSPDFRSNSSYENNLHTLLSSLASNASNTTGNGYYSTNTTIYGAFLCRGDIAMTGNSDSCDGCVATATADMPPKECPTNIAAAIWYDKCMVRYSNEPFLGIVDESAFQFWKNDDDISSFTPDDVNGFVKLVGQTLSDLATQTGTANPQEDQLGARKYFGTKQATFNSYVTLFAMSQCTPDLAPIDCRRCLTLVINEMSKYCNGSKGCRILNPSCNTRYETYPFDESVPPPAPPPPVLPPPPTPPPPPPIRRRSYAVNIVLGVLVLFLVTLVSVFIYLRCRRRTTNNNVGSIVIQNRARDAPKFDPAMTGEGFMTNESLQYDLATLQDATDNFSDDNKLGQGGFGIVYKGTLSSGQEIAVKRLSKNSHQGKDEFRTEVEFVAKLQHRNLVRLLGYCIATDEKLLVYEFVPRKSLDLILFDPERQGQLNWSTRYRIIQGISRGILYLHEDSRFKIVHRDLKASNVLLDADMNPKISDFGLARNFEVNQEHDITSRPAGTPGYMAPEYIEYGEFSTKSDVYSFGVLVLEIISGKKISNRRTGLAQNLLAYAWKHWNDDTPLAFADASLQDSYSSSEVIRCMHLGLLCVQGEIEDRPSMISIVSYLNSTNLAPPAPHKPAALLSSITKGSMSGIREISSEKSTKTASSSRTTEPRSDNSTSRSKNSSSGIEVYQFVNHTPR